MSELDPKGLPPVEHVKSPEELAAEARESTKVQARGMIEGGFFKKGKEAMEKSELSKEDREAVVRDAFLAKLAGADTMRLAEIAKAFKFDVGEYLSLPEMRPFVLEGVAAAVKSRRMNAALELVGMSGVSSEELATPEFQAMAKEAAIEALTGGKDREGNLTTGSLTVFEAWIKMFSLPPEFMSSFAVETSSYYALARAIRNKAMDEVTKIEKIFRIKRTDIPADIVAQETSVPRHGETLEELVARFSLAVANESPETKVEHVPTKEEIGALFDTLVGKDRPEGKIKEDEKGLVKWTLSVPDATPGHTKDYEYSRKFGTITVDYCDEDGMPSRQSDTLAKLVDGVWQMLEVK